MLSILRNYLEWNSPPIAINPALPLRKYYLAMFGYEINRLASWRLDIALRYAPANNIIKKYGDNNSSILEVGCGSAGITSLLRKKVFGVDLNFTGIKLGLLDGCKASALNLPFGDRQFDFVVSMDMLEHIEPTKRKDALYEICRCAKSHVILGVPCGEDAQKYDFLLNELLKRKLGIEHEGQMQHVINGLPDHEEITSMIKETLRDLNRNYNLQIIDNFNLRFWLLYWRFQISKNQLIMLLKNKLFMPIFPILKFFNVGKCYRKIWVINLS